MKHRSVKYETCRWNIKHFSMKYETPVIGTWNVGRKHMKRQSVKHETSVGETQHISQWNTTCHIVYLQSTSSSIFVTVELYIIQLYILASKNNININNTVKIYLSNKHSPRLIIMPWHCENHVTLWKPRRTIIHNAPDIDTGQVDSCYRCRWRRSN